jgi:hypothetical protein
MYARYLLFDMGRGIKEWSVKEYYGINQRIFQSSASIFHTSQASRRVNPNSKYFIDYNVPYAL